MKKIKIKVKLPTKTKGDIFAFSIEGTIIENGLSDHDLAACLFAIEFATNNHSQIPMRIHINEE